jgi:hypothetical protein
MRKKERKGEKGRREKGRETLRANSQYLKAEGYVMLS